MRRPLAILMLLAAGSAPALVVTNNTTEPAMRSLTATAGQPIYYRVYAVQGATPHDLTGTRVDWVIRDAETEAVVLSTTGTVMNATGGDVLFRATLSSPGTYMASGTVVRLSPSNIIATIAYDSLSVTSAAASTCPDVTVNVGGGSSDAVSNGAATVQGQAISNGAAIHLDYLTNGAATINGTALTNGAAIVTAAGSETQGLASVLSQPDAAGGSATNLNRLQATGTVDFTAADIRVPEDPAYGDSPASKSYVDGGATAYVTNAVNRLVFPDATTNSGLTILALTDPNFTNVAIDGAGKATIQMKPIPTRFSYDEPPAVASEWDDEFSALTTNANELCTNGWFQDIRRTSAALTISNGHLIASVAPPNTGDNWSSLGKALPAAPWRFEACIYNAAWSNYQAIGLAILSTNGGPAVVCWRNRRAGAASAFYHELAYFSRPGAIVNAAFFQLALQGFAPYYAVENDGTNIWFEISENGTAWGRFQSTPTNNLWGSGTTIPWTRIGLWFDWAGGTTNLAQATQPWKGSVDWFRRVK